MMSHRTHSTKEQVKTAEWVIDLTTDLRSEKGQTETAPFPVQATEAADTDSVQQQTHPSPSSIPAIRDNTLPQAIGGQTITDTPQSVSLERNKDIEMASAFRNTMDNQAILMQMRQFFRMASSSVKGMVDGSMQLPDKTAMDGKRGNVTIAYNNSAAIESLSVTSENAELKEFLQSRINWYLAPTPKSCSLPFNTVTYSISITRNRVNIAISPG